jgi:uncharacterized membrane protein
MKITQKRTMLNGVVLAAWEKGWKAIAVNRKISRKQTAKTVTTRPSSVQRGAGRLVNG